MIRNLRKLLNYFRRARPDPLAALRHDLENLNQKTNMKLSQLSSSLATLVTQTAQIATDLATLKSAQADPELPAEAAANLTALQSGLQSVADSVKPPTAI